MVALARVVAMVARSLCAVQVCVRSPGRLTDWGWLNNPLEGLCQCGAVARCRDTWRGAGVCRVAPVALRPLCCVRAVEVGLAARAHPGGR